MHDRPAEPATKRAWVNFAWQERYGYPFDAWVADRIDAGASAREVAREIAEATDGAATVAPNSLSAWYPEFRGDTVAAA